MNTVRRAAYSWPAVVILGIIAVSMIVAVWNIYQKEELTRANLDQITETHDVLQEREAELVASVNSLETTFGVESEIRDKFGLVREGEEVVVVVDGGEEKGENNDVGKKKSWWERIKSIF